MSKGQADKPLHILHIILALTPTNGQYNEHILPLLDVRKFTICTYFKSDIKPPAEVTLFEGNDTVRGFFRTLRAALEADEYDIIHVHTPHAGVLLMATLFMAGLYRKLKSSTVHTIQNSWQNFKLRNQLMFIPSFPLFERLIFCGQASYESFPSILRWMGGDRMHVVANAMDIDRIDRIINSEKTLFTDQFKVVTIGLIKMKNPFTVLEAFRKSQDQSSALVYLGEGALRPQLEAEIEKAGLQNQVSLTGMIPRDRVFEQFKEADLFLSASWGEGLPVAVLEAMASRCPVLLSDIPPHREIADGVDFIPLVKPGDAEGFAREIKKFQAMTTSERVQIGNQCRALVEDRYSLPAMHSGLEEIYSQITRDHAPLRFELIR